MTLVEAIKSGKRFRRALETRGVWLEIQYNYVNNAYTKSSVQLNAVEILADDWEIEEPTIEITKTQLASAYRKHCTIGCDLKEVLHLPMFIELCKDLGI